MTEIEELLARVVNESGKSRGEIEAKIVLVEIFSMYCPICQREAGHVNQVFEMIKADEHLNRDIRMLGIGSGNSGFEAQFFKTKYNIEFPLFSDADFSIHKKLKEVGTPHFFVLKILPGKAVKLLLSHSGEIPEPAGFVNRLKRVSGLENHQ